MTMANPSEIQRSLYRAVWRWHFCAGFLALPFLVILAVTGGLYLFKAEIDHMIYRSMLEVPAQSAPPAPASVLVHDAATAFGGRVLQVTVPEQPQQSVKMIVSTAANETRTVFLDPYNGKIIGSTAYGGIMQMIRKIHSLQYFGFWASCLMEVTAGWTIVLAFSGIYLWWPRGRRGGVLTVRGAPRTRWFWRDLHAVTGVLASAVILFLAVTGMPWTKVWGKYVQQWTTSAGLGQPKPPAEVLREWQLAGPGGRSGKATHHHDHASEFQADLPWALEKTAPPDSIPLASQHRVIGVDAALEIVNAAGLPKPFTLALPIGPRGAYMASYRPDQVEKTRIIYVDQYSGQILGDTGFVQYGPAAKVIEWGVAVHQGLEYGTLNRLLMLAGCVAILMLAMTAPVMWWKRRPKGSWALPPAPADPRIGRGVGLIMAVAGLVFPLMGLSMIAVVFSLWFYDMAKAKLETSREVPAA